MSLTHKLVAVINKELEPGVALNALAHMTIGLGAHLGKGALDLDDYVDAEGHTYPNISKMPFIILRAKSNEIKKTIHVAREQNIPHGIFINTMTGGTYTEQMAHTQSSTEENLVFYGCVLCGPQEDVNQITRKFSLWR